MRHHRVRRIAILAVVVFCLAAVAGCSGDDHPSSTDTTESEPQGSVENTDRYDRLTLECEILAADKIAEVVGGTSAQGTFNGAICRWVVTGANIVNVTFNWFEWNNLNVEKETAKRLGYETENIRVASQAAFTQRDPKRPSSICGVTARAPSRGIFTWWVEPRGAPSGDPCAAPIKLMELVLNGGQ